MNITLPGFSKTNKKEIICEVNNRGCWECISYSFDSGGYPHISINGKKKRMSRLMYENHIGEIPKGMVVRHKCDNPKCINPAHLEIGTSKDNAQDKIIRKRFKQFKLNEDDVKIILVMLKNRVSRSSIAKQFGVGKTTITDIAQMRSWEYIPRP